MISGQWIVASEELRVVSAEPTQGVNFFLSLGERVAEGRGRVRGFVPMGREEKLRELLTDPDAGLVLRPEVQERLRMGLQESKTEGENIPAAEVARRWGLEW